MDEIVFYNLFIPQLLKKNRRKTCRIVSLSAVALFNMYQYELSV